jgi:putative glutamine amidotransferase
MAVDEKALRPDSDAERPLIGVTAGSCEVRRPGVGTLPAHYIDRCNPRAVVQAGGDPVLLPAVAEADADAPERYAELLDGFVISGGTDIAPSAYGGVSSSEAGANHDLVRDAFEIALVRAARERGKPIFGVCRGMELINVAFGGSLTEARHPAESVAVDGFERVVLHQVELSPESLAAAVYESETVDVWCLHSQAPGEIAGELRATGRSQDGVVEVLEGDARDGFLLGVLFHPEFMLERNPAHLKPYAALVRAAAAHRPRAEGEQHVGLVA